MPRSRTTARRRPTRRLVAIGVAAAVAAAGLLVTNALAATSSGSASYRTAAAATGSVSQTLHRSGTIEPVAQATVVFPIAGTIASVGVQPGASVVTGQTLAAVATAALESDLASKRATLAASQLTLSDALQRATTATTSTTSTTVADTPSAAKSSPLTQPQVYAALAAAATAVQQATSSCSGTTGDCVTAQQSALAALQTALDAESSLAQAAGASTSTAAASATGAAQTSRTSSAAAPATAAPSAADLVADQAAVDAASANVTAAQQALAQGTIVSPINGTVAAVNLISGQQVSAGSSTANVVIEGPGGYEVSTTVPVSDIGKVELGDPATVTPDGAGATLDGKVVALGAAPSTSGTTTTYPVVIGLTGSPSGLRNGASAAATITVAHATSVLTVPTSAVHTAGGLTFVTVLAGGKTRAIPVQAGAVGPDLTEITSGLHAGQVVVLADLGQALPTSTSTNSRVGGGLGGTGGFGGGASARVIAGG